MATSRKGGKMNHASSNGWRPLPRLLTAGLGFLALLCLDARPAFSAVAEQAAATDPLRSENPRVRRRAANDLGKSGGPDALPRLAELVRDPDSDVRLAVLRSIASLRELAGVPSMVVFMGDAEAKLRLEAVDGVVEIYTRRDRPRTSKFLSIFSDGRDKPEPMVVAPVDFQVYRSLAGLLKDSDKDVRESAAEAIGILGGTEVAVDLVAALRDASDDVRAAAVTAIVKVGTSADGEALSPLIADRSSSVRRRAISGLGRLKVAEAAPGLRQLFARSPDSEDGLLALSALAQLALPEDRLLFQGLVIKADPNLRRPSIEGLARLGNKANEANFKRAFQREKVEELRVAYAFALFLFGDRPFLDTVVLGLGGSNDLFRQSRGYLEEFGASALPEVLDYFQEPDAKIRSGLCDALANVGVVDALPAIEPLLSDRDRQVAASAARAVAILKRQH